MSDARPATRLLRTCVAILVIAPVFVGQLSAQLSQRRMASRADLEALLDYLEQSQKNSPQISLIRQRLAEGDFQVGDQISLRVQGDPSLSTTYTVATGRKLVLPDIPDISLVGVLRSELPEYLTTELNKYIRDARVDVTTLMRIAVLGEVATPGFYHVPPDTPVSEIFMLAGGPTSNADFGRTVARRGTADVVSSDDMQLAITQGESLDAINLRGGDALVVGNRSGGFWNSAGRILLGAGALAASVIGITAVLSN